MHTYRVWMRDGYASLHHTETEAEARQEAIDLATKNCRDAAMTKAELRKALAVDYVEQLDKEAASAD